MVDGTAVVDRTSEEEEGEEETEDTVEEEEVSKLFIH